MQFAEKIGITFNKKGKEMLQFIDITQIKNRIEGQKEEQKKLYASLGEKYFAQIKENPPEIYVELVKEILEHQKIIDEYLGRLDIFNRQRRCSYCGADLIEEAVYCVQCGKEVKEKAIEQCTVCGSNLNEGDAYCSGCGKKIEK